MNIDWSSLQTRYNGLGEQLTGANLSSQEREKIQKEFTRLGELLSLNTSISAHQAELADIKSQLAAGADAEMAELYHDEVVRLEAQLEQDNAALEDILYPPEAHDNRSVFLEIRAGAGGQEASLFAADLLKMYSNYAEKKGWRAKIDTAYDTDLGGYREVTLHISGKGVYGHLKRESGVHRVQRVPATETAGRVHTSTVTVAVLPEADEVDVVINPSDLRIDVFRASGAGGQHVNTTDSAVRITHIPSGVVVSCQDERSQHKNKAKALKVLQSRLLAHQVEQERMRMAQQRKEQVGTGMRSEKVRTYNYPQNRVTDHQVDLTLKNLDYVMEGDLDEIIQALRAQDREERKQRALAFEQK